MHKLLEGIHQFQRDVFESQEEHFIQLVKGQQPEVLFITCSDSRLNPDLLMQAAPGDLFVLRNAGNIIPVYDRGLGGEAATIEFALEVLKVRHIVVCGHSHCGAVQALISPDSLARLPAVEKWLQLAEPTRQLVEERYGHLDHDARLNVAIQENVLLQLESLRTHPTAARGLDEGRLNLHAWVYKFETGEVFAFHPDHHQFLPLKAAGYKPSV